MLLFQQIGVLGVAWFRIASAAIFFATWAKPWKVLRSANKETVVLLLLLGACLAFMNSAFYLAIARLPLSLVATMEFVGTIAVALFGLRAVRNYVLRHSLRLRPASHVSAFSETYALLLSLLPATATIIGAVVLGQIPTLKDIAGILLVMVGVAIHKPAAETAA